MKNYLIKNRKGRKKSFELYKPYTDIDGVHRNKYINSFYTREEAETVGKKLSKDLNVDYYNVTFEKLYSLFVEDRRINKKVKNPEAYVFAYKAVAPFLAERKYKDLTNEDLFNALKAAKKNGPSNKNIMILFTLMNKYAIKKKIVDNFFSEIEVGRYEKSINKNPNSREHKAIGRTDIIKLLNDQDYPFMSEWLSVLLYTGMRISEFITLKKKAIDLKRASITIFEEYAKTGNSARDIPISQKIYGTIEKYYNQCKNPEDFLFKNPITNKALTYSAFNQTFWKRWLTNFNLEHRVHDTRVTFKTTSVSQGLNQTIVEKILGHGLNSKLEDTYVKFDWISLLEEINKLDYEKSYFTTKEEEDDAISAIVNAYKNGADLT